MKKHLLLMLLLFSMNAFSQPYTYWQVGDSINTLDPVNIGPSFPLSQCLSQPPYNYEWGITIGPALSNPPTGLRWIFVVDSVNVSVPDSAYTLEAGPMHAGDTLEFASHSNSIHLHVASPGEVGISYGLTGVLSVAGESYCLDYVSHQSGSNYCNSGWVLGDSCLRSAQVLDSTYTGIQIITSGSGYPSEYVIDNAIAESGGGCNGWGHPTGPAIMVAVLDSCRNPWSNENVDHGNWNMFCGYPMCIPDSYVCRPRPENYFVYSFYDTASFARLHEWMRDSVPDGNYVFIYSWQTYSWSQAPVELNNMMNELGCPSWPPADSVPFIFAVRKGMASQLDTMIAGTTPNDTLLLDVATTNGCTVGIHELNEENNMVLFPNPAHDSFTINITGELKIYDVTGRLVKEQTVNRKQETVNCKLSAGIYFVRVRDGARMYAQKLVIE